jgi:hypothetical protein
VEGGVFEGVGEGFVMGWFSSRWGLLSSSWRDARDQALVLCEYSYCRSSDRQVSWMDRAG